MNEIRLYGPIGEYPAISAEEIARSIPADATEVTIRINSLGGSIADGLAMYNYLRDHKARVTTIVDGFAASAASIVLQAGDVRKVHAGSVVMLHHPWTGAVGNARELRQTAAALDETTEAMYAVYLARTGMEREDLEEICDNETFMAGRRAVELGLADEISEDVSEQQIAAMVDLVGLVAKQRGMKQMEKTETPTVAATEPVAAIEAAPVAAAVDPSAEVHELKARLAQSEEVAARLQQMITETNAERDSQAAQIRELSAECDKLKAALANPAHMDAAIKPATATGGITDAEADELDRKARSKADDGKPRNVLEQYEAMPYGKDRQAFLKAHEREIFRLMETGN